MTTTEAIYQKQTLWALRKGISFKNESRAAGKVANYVTRLEDNLFVPLCASGLAEFEAGAGSELESKLLALHASAAVVVNFMEYWRQRGELDTLARSLELPEGVTSLQYEVVHRIIPNALGNPHLDAQFTYEAREKVHAVAVESKTAEPYRDRPKPLNPAYSARGCFNHLPGCEGIAAKLGTEDGFRYLSVAQLLTHIFGLRRTFGSDSGKFILLYFWLDVSGEDGFRHRQEIETFSQAVRSDGIDFRAATHQEVILRMASLRSEHPQYVDYLAERYL